MAPITSKITFLLLLIFLIFACTNDSESTKNTLDIDNLISGRWELAKAVRNGKVAPTMEGTYFEFSGSNSMKTNMMGRDEVSTFTREDRTISTSNNGMQTDYIVENITKDSLSLTTTIRNFQFSLLLLRAANKANNKVESEPKEDM